MEIKITDNRKIADIQREFNTLFPFLKIEFFSKPSNERGENPKDFVITGDKTVGDCRKIHNKGDLSIFPFQTVGTLEKMCEEKFGMHVQVFRAAGKNWLETTATDNWTLKEQNETGEEYSKPVKE